MSAATDGELDRRAEDGVGVTERRGGLDRLGLFVMPFVLLKFTALVEANRDGAFN